MRTYLHKLGQWLVDKYGVPKEVAPVIEVVAEQVAASLPRTVVEQVVAIVRVVEADIPGASPENKHARAFARVRRALPQLSKRDASLAIELALRHMG